MRWTKSRARALINAILMVMLVALYISMTTPVAKSALGELYSSPIFRGHEKGIVGLECAVNWDAAAMPELLAILRERNVKITFFVSGQWAMENKAMLKHIVQDGHEIGTMGYAPMEDGSARAVAADVEKSLRAIAEACGVMPNMYYSGSRVMGNSTKAARKLGLKHVLCTTDMLSGRGSAEDIFLRALEKPFDGSIVLMQPTEEAVKALPAILDGLKQQGFHVGTVSETLGENDEEKEVRV